MACRCVLHGLQNVLKYLVRYQHLKIRRFHILKIRLVFLKNHWAGFPNTKSWLKLNVKSFLRHACVLQCQFHEGCALIHLAGLFRVLNLWPLNFISWLPAHKLTQAATGYFSTVPVPWATFRAPELEMNKRVTTYHLHWMEKKNSHIVFFFLLFFSPSRYS